MAATVSSPSARPRSATAARVTFNADLATSINGVALVQECVPEELELKRDLLARAGRLNQTTVLASSSSALVPSQYAAGLVCQDRVLGGHPGNSPYLIPVLELVPSIHTSAETVDMAEGSTEGQACIRFASTASPKASCSTASKERSCARHTASSETASLPSRTSTRWYAAGSAVDGASSERSRRRPQHSRRGRCSR